MPESPKPHLLLLLLISLALLPGLTAFGQERDEIITPTPPLIQDVLGHIDLNKDLLNQLIPLDSIVQIALRNSPTVQAQDALIDAGREQIKFARREWQNGVTGFLTQSYGNQSTFFDSNQEPNTIQTQNLQTGFRLGLNVNIPLFLLFGRTSRINVFEHEMEVRQKTGEKLALDISRMVITEYNDMLSAHRIMLLAAKNRGTTRLLQDMADKQFAQGDISIADYSGVAAITAKSEQDYEIARGNFYSSYQTLEKLLGVRLDTLMRKK